MATSGASRLARGGRKAVAIALVAGLAGAAVPGSASASSPVAQRAGGEAWYGYLLVEGLGTQQTTDGGVYTNRDRYHLSAPTDASQGKMNITIDVTITHTDPDPTVDACYARLETWSGVGVVDASFTVQSNVGGSNYMIDATALAPIQVNTSVKYGGVVGGQPCSLGDVESTTNIAPWLSIHSAQDPLPAFRNGKHTVAKAEPAVTCGVVSECTDFPSFGGHFPKRIRSTWSIAARECTGYSKAYRLGKDDTAFVFSPCQTKSLSSRVTVFQEISGQPKICDYAFVKRLNQACDGYKAVTRVQWGQVDWFMSAATRVDACGVWVVNRASWRPPKVEPASRPDGLNLVWINVGESALVQTADGTRRVTCP